MITMMGLVGRLARERGGGTQRVRPPADVADLHECVARPHVASSTTILQKFHVIAEATPNGHRIAQMPLATKQGRLTALAAAPHGVAKLCLFG